MGYFTKVSCIEELKRQYYNLALQYHPDRGGSKEQMQAINAEYEKLFARYKDIHKSVNASEEPHKNNETHYKSATPTNECPEDFIHIVEALLSLKGIDVELCGRWLWISGNTYPHKSRLCSLGCIWHHNKQKWSWHYAEDSSKYKHKEWSMEKIRNTFGSKTFAHTPAHTLLEERTQA